MQTLICDGCGIEFSREKSRVPGWKAYHNAECQRINQRYTTASPYSKKGAYAATHVCAKCLEELSARHPGVKYCNDSCRRRAQLDRTYDRWKNRQVVDVDYEGKNKKQYKLVLMTQQPDCPICKRSFSEMHLRQVHVDHDHVTGKIRGLLCFKCNAGLGQFSDDVSRLTAAINYLQTHKDGVSV